MKEELKQETLKLYEEYKTGMSTVKLAKKYGIGASAIGARFRSLGLELRSNKINSRKYHANFSYFNDIDTEEKAYWLGFIAADGYLTSEKHGSQKFGVSLSSKDKEHIIKLNNQLDSTYPIHDYEVSSGYKIGTPYSRLIIQNDEICNDLQKHGITHNKTNILKRPNIPMHLEKHWIRGYIDGDGCLYQSSKTGVWNLEIVGNDDVLMFIAEHLLQNNISISMPKLVKRNQNHIASCIKYGGRNLAPKLYSYLYKDSKVYLNRKFNKAKQCF